MSPMVLLIFSFRVLNILIYIIIFQKNSNHLPADLFNTRRESDVGRRRSARMHVDDNGYLFNLKRDTPSDPNIVYSNNSPWHVKGKYT